MMAALENRKKMSGCSDKESDGRQLSGMVSLRRWHLIQVLGDKLQEYLSPVDEPAALEMTGSNAGPQRLNQRKEAHLSSRLLGHPFPRAVSPSPFLVCHWTELLSGPLHLTVFLVLILHQRIEP